MRTDALLAARTAAAVARQDASAENIAAVRAAIAGALGSRRDAVTVAAGGLGYNPYRDEGGKFAPGAHKQKPTAGERAAVSVAKAKERVDKTKARVETHAQKLEQAHNDKHDANTNVRNALHDARKAGELARAKPTAKNIKAAQVATNKATRAQAKVAKHDAAIGKRTQMYAKATAAHAKAVEAHAKVQAKLAESKSESKGKGAKGKGEKDAKTGTDQKEKASTGDKPKESPTETRTKNASAEHELLWHDSVTVLEHAANGDVVGVHHAMDRQISALGLEKSVESADRGKVITKSVDELAALGALAARDWEGRILVASSMQDQMREFGRTVGNRKIDSVLNEKRDSYNQNRAQSDALYTKRTQTTNKKIKQQLMEQEHAHDDEASRAYQDGKKIQTGAEAMSTMMHETLHGFSPMTRYGYQGHGAQIEEITTEVSTRHLMTKYYGRELIPSDKGSYGEQIHATTKAIAELTGQSHDHAYGQLQEISLQFKRRASGSLRNPTEVREAFALDIARHVRTSLAHAEAVLTRHLDSAPIARTQ